MPTIAQQVAANQARIAAGGETGTGVGPQHVASTAPTTMAPPQDLPAGGGLPQRGMFPANLTLNSDRSDSNRAFRGAGVRSSTFPYAPNNGSISTTIVQQAQSSASSGGSGSVSNLTAGPGISITSGTGGKGFTVSGTVGSIVVPSIFSITGALPVTAFPDGGTIFISLVNQPANFVLAGPTSGGSATPTFRFIVNVDLANAIFGASGPSHNPGAVPDPGSVAGTTRFLREDGTWVTVGGGTNIQTTNYTALGTDVGKLIAMDGSATAPSFGAPVFVTGGVGAAASVHTLTTLNTATGDLIVVAVSWVDTNSRTISSVTDTAGNTYTPLTSSGHSSGNNIVQFFYVIGATANAANTITATFSGAVSQNANICAWGVSTAGSVSLDVQTASTGTSATPTTNSFSTTGSTEIVFVCVSDAQTPCTAGTGYTLDNGQFDSHGQANSAAQHRTFSSPQAGITASFTASANAFFAIGLAAFKATSVPATLTLKLPASPPTSAWNIFVENIGTGPVIINPNGLTLDTSASNVTVNPGQGLYITTDGNNYFSERGLLPALILLSDSGGIQSDSVALVGQTASIGATNLVASPTSTSLYQISYYLNETTAGTSGTVTVTFTWNDGASQSVTSATVTFGTLGAFASGVLIVKATSGAVQYSTTVTSPVGSPAYSLDIRVLPLG